MTTKTFIRRVSQDRRGQSLVEYALVVMMFFILLFGMFDFGRLFYVKMTLENAMRQAGRFAVTGSHLTDPVTSNQMSRVNSIIQIAKAAAIGLDISNIQISSVSGGSTGPGAAGGPGDTVTVSMTTQLKLITPIIGRYFGRSGIYPFTVSTTFRNERFPSSQTQ